MPEQLTVYGVEGRWFSPGRGLSPEVRLAAGELVGTLLRRLGNPEELPVGQG